MKTTLGLVLIVVTQTASAADLNEALVSCTVCHGINLQGNQPTLAPSLAGMAPWYLKSQLLSFRQGTRGTHGDDFAGMEMQPQAAILDLAVIDPLVGYIADLPEIDAPSSLSGDAAQGKVLYQSCAVCHGADGRGDEAQDSPGLTGRDDWYLRTQLNNYLRDIRNVTNSDQRMTAAAKILEGEADVADVIAYINTLGNNIR